VKVGDCKYEVKSDEGNDFTYGLEYDPTTEPFDHSAYLDKDVEPVVDDLLNDTLFLHDWSTLLPVAFKASVANLETIDNLILFHKDPEADITSKVHKYEEIVAYNDNIDFIEDDKTGMGAGNSVKILNHKCEYPHQTGIYKGSS